MIAEFSYTAEHFKAAMPAHKPPSKMASLLRVCFTLFFTLIVIVDIAKGRRPELLPIILAAMGWFVTVMFFVLDRITDPELMLKKHNRKYPNSKNVFTFEDDAFTIECIADANGSKNVLSYDKILSAEVRGGFFIIDVEKLGITVFRTTEITEGTPEELLTFLKEKIGTRFSLRNRQL